MNERVAKLEEQVANLRRDVGAMAKDVRATRDAIVGARWAGRLVLAAASIVGAAVGWIVK